MAPSDETPDPDEQTPEQRRALFRVVRGEPDDAELAALLVAFAALTDAPAPPAIGSGWSETSWRPGPDAWRLSGLPR